MSKNVPKQGAVTDTDMRHEAEATIELEDTERHFMIICLHRRVHFTHRLPNSI